jgi:hypothetical protein
VRKPHFSGSASFAAIAQGVESTHFLDELKIEN